MTKRIILFAAALLAAFAAAAQAATYYVDCDDPAASDSYSDEQATSEATPWKTLWYAGWRAKPGDTVLVKDGECPDPDNGDTQAAMLMQDGEAAGRKWTYFKAYPGHHPHIRFKPNKTGIHIQGSYIWIEGFEVSPDNYNPGEISCATGNNSGFGIWITGGHHSVVRNCNVHHCAAAGIGGNWADYMTIENNTIWNNAWWSNCDSSGIHIFQPLASEIDFGATTVNGTDYRIVIANNRLYGNENKYPPAGYNLDHPVDGNGIALDDFGWKQPNSMLPDQLNKLYSHRTLIMNNLIYGNGGRGIQADAGYVDVLHNLSYKNLQNKDMRENCPAANEFGIGGIDMRIFNNIVFAQYNNALWLKYDWPFVGHPVGMEKKIVYGNNLIYGGGTDTDDNATDAGGNFTQDPLLAAPGLNADSDFHLLSNSPAINKGSAADSVPLDFDGFARPIGILPDIGAYEAMSDTAKTVNPANGHSYQRFSTSKTWNDAKAACAALGGYLATVTSQEEQKYVTSKGAYAWLGAADETQEGAWKWITGEPWSYTNWSGGEPNDLNGGEDCLHLWPDGTWNDNGGPGSSKDTALPYICEWSNGSPAASWLPAMYKLLLDGK